MQLAVGEVFEEAVAHEPNNILPIVVPFVSQFFLQHRTDGNEGCKSIAEKHELKKETPA